MSDPFRATALVHDWIRARLRPGDAAIDATAGTGQDTLFLARLVGETGRVFAFDIQAHAVEATRILLAEHGCLSRVALYHAPHETMASVLPSPGRPVRAAMFNLGYLPGGDPALITRPASTLAAAAAALEILAAGGLMTVVCYPAHDGGAEEAAAIEQFCSQLDPERFRALRCHQLLVAGSLPPLVLAIEKRR